MRNSASEMKDQFFWREFWILFGAGLIADAVLVVISHLPTTPIAMLLLVKGYPRGSIFLGVATAETVIELALAVGLGLLAARSFGLGSPILEKWLRGERIGSHLRTVFLPSLLVGVMLGLWAIVPNLPMLHPNRKPVDREAEKILNSPTKAKIAEFAKRTSGPPMNGSELALYYVCGAVSGELFARLFLLSGIIWILAKITHNGSVAVSPSLFWTAIFLLIAVEAIHHLAWQAIFQSLMFSALGTAKLPRDSFWLIAVRALLGIIPASIGPGWLYVRRGLESAVVGSLIASVAAHAATIFLLARLY